MKHLFTFLFLLFFGHLALAQKKTNSPTPVPDKGPYYEGMKWRNVGPARGGRSLAVAGHKDQPLTYYFGAVGGGVWKTEDGGNNWNMVSDSTFKSSSVGAIAVAPSDPNVVYVGMGEADMRSNISFGDGMYKSTDAGKTWKHIGLPKADAIATVEVHPTDANTVYVAAVGNPFSPNTERGVFRSTDGGNSWKHILAKNDSTGAYHVRIDPNNPRVIYATLWQAYRNAHSMSSGGPHCGLFKSTDGGDTWVDLSKKPGMPKGLLGKIGIAVSPANSNRLYALIENENGGLFTSRDGGEHWSLVNNDKNLWQRPWYYMNLQADPKNEDDLIILNVNAFKSTDGGKTVRRINVNHGDTHDIWINPNNPMNYIIGDDGGGEVTFNDGYTFTDLDFPTAQFYHVHLDNDFPYHIYGSQQDNSTIKIASRTDGYSIGMRDWKPVAGGESGYIAIDPTNSKITYGGSYDGYMTKFNEENNQEQNIMVYPENNMGHTSAEKRYRFQWTFPIVFSPHNSSKLYCTSQYVHVSYDGGQSWETISPDLSRNDPKTTGKTGGPITLDQTGAEIYATIFTLEESPLEKGVLWAGSDDGLVHITTDDAASWKNVSIPEKQLPEFARISIIHSSNHSKGKAYLAANRYEWGDRTPYLFKTTDYGKSWINISKGIPADEYTRVVREDPNKEGLLYAGTERGVYVSFDDGMNWSSLSLNLPNTPVRDLQIQAREKDLVIATHGLSFWVLDDLSPLYEIKDGLVKGNHLFKPRAAYRMQGGQGSDGTNAENGLAINYFFKEKPSKEVKLLIKDSQGEVIREYTSLKDFNGKEVKSNRKFYEDEEAQSRRKLPAQKGFNHFSWNMRMADVTEIEGEKAPMWAGGTRGPKVAPGNFSVELYHGEELIGKQAASILKDPRVETPVADLEKQFALAKKVYHKVDETHKAINHLRKVKSSVNGFLASITDSTAKKEFQNIGKPIVSKADSLEQLLLQNKAKAVQDLLAYPIRLNDKLSGILGVVESADTAPTKGSYEAFEDLSAQADVVINAVNALLEKEVPSFNALVKEKQLPAININK